MRSPRNGIQEGQDREKEGLGGREERGRGSNATHLDKLCQLGRDQQDIWEARNLRQGDVGVVDGDGVPL